MALRRPWRGGSGIGRRWRRPTSGCRGWRWRRRRFPRHPRCLGVRPRTRLRCRRTGGLGLRFVVGRLHAHVASSRCGDAIVSDRSGTSDDFPTMGGWTPRSVPRRPMTTWGRGWRSGNAVDPRPLILAGARAERTTTHTTLDLIAEVDGRAVGAGGVGWGPTSAESRRVFLDCWVLPERRRSGIGGRLWDQLSAFADGPPRRAQTRDRPPPQAQTRAPSTRGRHPPHRDLQRPDERPNPRPERVTRLRLRPDLHRVARTIGRGDTKSRGNDPSGLKRAGCAPHDHIRPIWPGASQRRAPGARIRRF